MMVEFDGSASIHVDASPEAVLDLVTDLNRLPAWNAAIERVVEQPETLTAGAEWVVVMHPHGLPRWNSRSRVAELDRGRCRFSYETGTDDGNPSRAAWTWRIDPSGSGADVSVSWHVHPETIGRKVLGAPLRRRMLAREVPASLESLSRALTPASGQAGDVG